MKVENAYLTLFAAWLAFSLAAISPGPNLVAVASRAMAAGRSAGLAVAMGIAIGAFGWAIVTALGLSRLFDAFPILLRVLGLAGGAYLLWLGFKGIRSAKSGATSEFAAKSGDQGWVQDLLHGLAVTAGNPKVALVWVSLSTFVSSAVTLAPMLLLFASVSALLAFVIYGGYGLLFSMHGVRKLYTKFQRISDLVFGLTFCFLGGMMLYQTLLV